jgi:hypothetical protein
MHGRFFNITVALLWASSMTWLIVQKVLPSLRVGEPPSYQTILEAQKEESQVGWRLRLNDQEIGWALSKTERQPSGIVEITSCVHFNRLPLNEMAPPWIREIFRNLQFIGAERMTMESGSRLTIDPLGRLLRFDSTVSVGPNKDMIRMSGVVEGSRLQFQIRPGGLSGEFQLPPKALLGDALSPQTHLPNLRAGQTWTVPVFNPLLQTNASMEILHASVEEPEFIDWKGQILKAWVVVYRIDSGYGVSQQNAPQSTLWVREDGRVLQQKVSLFESVTMTFIRMSREESRHLAEDTLDSER